jgi:hypothetical protein
METACRHQVLTIGSRPKIASPRVMPRPTLNAPVPLDTCAVPIEVPRFNL